MATTQTRRRIKACTVFAALTLVQAGCGQAPRTEVDAEPAPAQPGVHQVTQQQGYPDTSVASIASIATSQPGQPDPQTGHYLTPYAQRHLKRGRFKWLPEWDQYVADALPSKMLSVDVPQDIVDVCPNFKRLSTDEMKTFWAFLLQAIAVPESGFNPTKTYRESEIYCKDKSGKLKSCHDRVTGKTIMSEGLLQLSYQDKRAHDCDFDYEGDLKLRAEGKRPSIHDPKRNLECGVKILYDQLFSASRGKHRALYTNYKPYWSVLRPATNQDVRNELKGLPSFCKSAHESPQR